jgi:regulatory protein
VSAVDPDDADEAEEAALRILGGAAQSAQALRAKLRRRGFSAKASARAVQRCRERGYIDDGALAESLAARLQRTGHGRARVAAELRARGIDADAAAALLDGLAAGDDERALEVGRRLLARELQRDDTDGARRRIAGALQRRGFSAGVIATTLRRLGDEARTPAG